MILGWGTQDEDDFEYPSTLSDSLLTINVTTTDCANDYYPPLTETWENGDYHKQQMYLCIDAPPEVGGPCKGDNGGNFSLNPSEPV